MTVHTLRPEFDLAEPSSLKLDLANPKPKDLVALIEAFEANLGANPDFGPLPVSTGWHDITPTMAVDFLRRNRRGANRKVIPGTVFYYASQMARGQWKATGQPMLFDANGVLIDAQHRAYAVVISGVTIKTFVVTDIEPIDNLFAYIDNSATRTRSSALATAGYNGVAPIIDKIVRIGEEVKTGVYNPGGATKLLRMSPADILGLVGGYPNAQKAARAAASDWTPAVDYLSGHKDTVAYLGMRIIDLQGEELADEFFEEVAAAEERASDDPIAALRKVIDRDNASAKPMRKHYRLAALIKAFNAWNRNEVLPRRWMLQVNEDFPSLDEAQPQSEAAE